MEMQVRNCSYSNNYNENGKDSIIYLENATIFIYSLGKILITP